MAAKRPPPLKVITTVAGSLPGRELGEKFTCITLTTTVEGRIQDFDVKFKAQIKTALRDGPLAAVLGKGPFPPSSLRAMKGVMLGKAEKTESGELSTSITMDFYVEPELVLELGNIADDQSSFTTPATDAIPALRWVARAGRKTLKPGRVTLNLFNLPVGLGGKGVTALVRALGLRPVSVERRIDPALGMWAEDSWLVTLPSDQEYSVELQQGMQHSSFELTVNTEGGAGETITLMVALFDLDMYTRNVKVVKAKRQLAAAEREGQERRRQQQRLREQRQEEEERQQRQQEEEERQRRRQQQQQQEEEQRRLKEKEEEKRRQAPSPLRTGNGEGAGGSGAGGGGGGGAPMDQAAAMRDHLREQEQLNASMRAYVAEEAAKEEAAAREKQAKEVAAAKKKKEEAAEKEKEEKAGHTTPPNTGGSGSSGAGAMGRMVSSIVGAFGGGSKEPPNKSPLHGVKLPAAQAGGSKAPDAGAGSNPAAAAAADNAGNTTTTTTTTITTTDTNSSSNNSSSNSNNSDSRSHSSSTTAVVDGGDSNSGKPGAAGVSDGGDTTADALGRAGKRGGDRKAGGGGSKAGSQGTTRSGQAAGAGAQQKPPAAEAATPTPSGKRNKRVKCNGSTPAADTTMDDLQQQDLDSASDEDMGGDEIEPLSLERALQQSSAAAAGGTQPQAPAAT